MDTREDRGQASITHLLPVRPPLAFFRFGMLPLVGGVRSCGGEVAAKLCEGGRLQDKSMSTGTQRHLGAPAVAIPAPSLSR